MSSTHWHASWYDSNEIHHHITGELGPGQDLPQGLLNHIGDIAGGDFPNDARLYLAQPETVLAPTSYRGQAPRLFRSLVDQHTPKAAIKSYALPWPEEASLIFHCAPALPAMWGEAASQGSVLPLAERDLCYLAHSDHADHALIHVLPGYQQISIKKEGKLFLCNAFRFREPEEAILMAKSALQLLFQDNQPILEVLFQTDSEKQVANKLAAELGATSVHKPKPSYWEH